MNDAASTSTATLVGTSTVTYGAVAPSPSSLLRSDDGQFAIVTRAEIHLLTPTLGYASKEVIDSSRAAARPLAGTKGGADALESGFKGKGKETDELAWLKTSAVLDKKNVIKWSDWADEYDLDMPGVVESHWRAASWSPSNLSRLGGCVLAAITSNGEALLYEAKKNATKGEWNEFADLTSGLVNELAPDQSGISAQTPQMRREMVAALLRCQTSAIAWSSAVPGVTNDLSLLALGHRSGEVSLWRLNDVRVPECLTRFSAADKVNIVNVVSWSNWTITHEFATAQLAIGDGDGRIFTVEVKQPLRAPAPSDVEVSDALSVCEADRRGATQLCWAISPTSGSDRLAYTKLGTVCLASVGQRGDQTVWEVQEVELPLVGQKHWMGSTPWAACSGLAFIPEKDSLLISLSSSAFYLAELSPAFRLIEDRGAHSAAALTSAGRELFEEVVIRTGAPGMTRSKSAAPGGGSGGGAGRISPKDGSRVMGSLHLEGSAHASKMGKVAYVFETARPDSSIYRTYGQIRTYLVVGDLDDPAMSEADAVQQVGQVLARPTNPRTRSPLKDLLLPLHYIRRFASSPNFVSDLLALLAASPSVDEDLALPDLETSVQEKFEARIWAEEGVQILRQKEALARALMRDENLAADMLPNAKRVHTDLLRSLIKDLLVKTAALMSTLELQESAKTVYSRLLLASASLLPATEDGEQSAALPADALSRAYEQGNVLCPACQAPVPLANTRYACCETGHQWERCSVTLDLISTVQVRTCTSCERKALLQSSDAVLNQLLELATCCLYCGGRWMRMR